MQLLGRDGWGGLFGCGVWKQRPDRPGRFRQDRFNVLLRGRRIRSKRIQSEQSRPRSRKSGSAAKCEHCIFQQLKKKKKKKDQSKSYAQIIEPNCQLQERNDVGTLRGAKQRQRRGSFLPTPPSHRIWHHNVGLATINARHHHLRSSRFLLNENEFRISPSRIWWKTQTHHHGRPRSPCPAAKGNLPSSSTPRGISILIADMYAHLGRESIAQRLERI